MEQTLRYTEIFQKQLIGALANVFMQETYFGDLVQEMTFDDVTFNETAFIVKRPQTKVKLQDYDNSTDLNNGKSRYGAISEHTWKDVEVPYEYLKAVNEAIDKTKINQSENVALTEVAVACARAFVKFLDKQIATKFVAAAKKNVAASVEGIVEAIGYLTDHEIVQENRVLKVCPELENTIVKDATFVHASKGMAMDMNALRVIGTFRGLEVQVVPTHMLGDAKGLIAVKNTAIAGQGIADMQTVQSTQMFGYQVQGVWRGLVHVDETIVESIVTVGKLNGTEGEDAGKSTVPDFDSMTVEQLKAYAVEHSIDLGEATKKADIIAAIKAA